MRFGQPHGSPPFQPHVSHADGSGRGLGLDRVPASETAQSDLHELKHVLDSTSRRLPFGIAQIGKAFRNEITPRNFIFRVREFEQMELEFFVAPGTGRGLA